MSKVTIACLQLAAHDLAQAEEALERALALIDAAGKHRPDLMVLPECTYPAYYLESLEAYRRAPLRPQDEVLRLFGAKAKAYGATIVAGIAQPATSGRLLNTAYVFNPQGEVAGSYSKSFLWHFDQTWFDPGVQFPTFELPFGRTGVFVCADGRMPEIARLLGVGGARLMVDSTAWVTGGGDRATLSNPQFEYMIATRAIENGAWIAVANKSGLEAESVVYCGRSCIVSPQGQTVAAASTTKEEFITAEIDLAQSAGLPVRRRPECYAALAQPTETLPVARLISEPVSSATTRLGAVQLKPYRSADDYLARVSAQSATLVRQGTSLVLLPGIPAGYVGSPAYAAERVLPHLLDQSRQLDAGLACPLISKGDDGKLRRSVYLLARGELIGTYHQVHLREGQAGEWAAGDELAVLHTPFGRIGVMLDEEGLLPEVTRVLMLQGAELVLWPSASSPYPLRTIARTRADENKVFVALATPLEEKAAPATAIVNPMGAVMAAAFPDVEQAIAGQIAWGLTRYKEMAPNTNVVLNRQPAAYKGLI